MSKRCNEWLKHFKINASGVFYNSIDESIFKRFYKDSKNKKITIGYIGRIIPEKGVLNLLEAFTILEKKYNNIELKIAGDDPILGEIKSKYESPNIEFTGKLTFDEVMHLCNNLDIFVNPSMYPEGLPTSILEAGIMKTAVIATDRGGTIEVICDDSIGLIVEENVTDLVNKLEYLINNPEKIEFYKENIYKRIIQNFTWDSTVKIMKDELRK